MHLSMKTSYKLISNIISRFLLKTTQQEIQPLTTFLELTNFPRRNWRTTETEGHYSPKQITSLDTKRGTCKACDPTVSDEREPRLYDKHVHN